MKLLYWSLGLLSLILLSLYTLLFTPLGNSLLKPIIEDIVQMETKLESKLELFTLSSSEIEIRLFLNKNNLVSLKGNYSLINRSVDLVYKINFEEVKSLRELLNRELDAILHIDGSIRGDIKSLLVKGTTDIASSQSDFLVVLEELHLKKINASIRALKIQEALLIAKKDNFAKGTLDMDVKISDTRVGSLKGELSTFIYDGVLNSKYFTKKYELYSMMPHTNFDISSHTVLDRNRVYSQLHLNSNLFDLDTRATQYDLKKKSLTGDYKLKVHNLNRFYFLVQKHLKGEFIANGEFIQDKELDITLFSKIAGGDLSANLHNDVLEANFKSLETLEVLDMILYPKIFSSYIDGRVDYNIRTSTGRFEGVITEGKFTQNEVLDLTKEYAHLDMYKENFSGAIDGDIINQNIFTTFDLRSRNSSITTKNSKLNMRDNRVDSKIDIDANKNLIEVKLKGDINTPDVTIDADELIKKEATRIITKEINKFLDSLF